MRICRPFARPHRPAARRPRPRPAGAIRLPVPLALALAFTAAAPVPGPGLSAALPDGRYLFMSSPDGAQSEGRSGTGILVFSIDQGHRFVKRIELPIFQEGIRGFTASAATRRAYFSTTNRRLGCFDLESEKVVWERQYPKGGCDRSCITADGKTIFAPTGWWYGGDDAGFLMIDAATGELVRQIPVGPRAHNSIAGLDGRHVFLGTTTKLTMFKPDGTVIKSIEPVGERGVFPYTVDSANHYAYVCLGAHVGFDVVDLRKGEKIHRVFASASGEKIRHRTHGAGMTPDEKELWISDQKGKRLFIFDLTQMPPAPVGHVDLSMGGHGWVTFSLDGKYAYCHTPDIFDAATKERVGTFKDERGKPFGSSKFVEVHFAGGEVTRVGNEFGLGRVAAGAK